MSLVFESAVCKLFVGAHKDRHINATGSDMARHGPSPAARDRGRSRSTACYRVCVPGRQRPEPRDQQPTDPNQAGYFVSVVWATTMMFIKLSILFYYRRLFLVQQKWLKIALWVNIVYAFCLGIGASFEFIFQCSPVPYFWERFSLMYGISPGYEGTCLPQNIHLATPAIMSTISDGAILVLPLAVLWKLQIRRAQKLSLMLVFALGIFVVAVGIARITFIFQVSNSSDTTCRWPVSSSTDFLTNYMQGMTWKLSSGAWWRPAWASWWPASRSRRPSGRICSEEWACPRHTTNSRPDTVRGRLPRSRRRAAPGGQAVRAAAGWISPSRGLTISSLVTTRPSRPAALEHRI